MKLPKRPKLAIEDVSKDMANESYAKPSDEIECDQILTKTKNM